MALDEATSTFIDMVVKSGKPPTHTLTPETARLGGAAFVKMTGPGPQMARTTDTKLDGLDGDTFAVRVHVPIPDPIGVIVYYHGGGWVLSNIDEFDTLARELAASSGCAVVTADYRKAPENRYPTALEDAWATYQWVEDKIEEIAGRSVPVIVAGDSAGGNLATLVALRARDRGVAAPLMQLLIYPITDCDLDTPSYRDPANQLLLTRESMAWFWDHYVPDAADRTAPEISPLRAGDLSGVAPAVVFTAEHDVLKSEGEAYAARLDGAGSLLSHHQFDGQMHGFFHMVNILPASRTGIEQVAGIIRNVLNSKEVTQ